MPLTRSGRPWYKCGPFWQLFPAAEGRRPASEMQMDALFLETVWLVLAYPFLVARRAGQGSAIAPIQLEHGEADSVPT